MASAMESQEEGVNFFIPMVDLVVSAIFLFIIIVMILVLLIQVPTVSESTSESELTASSTSEGTPVKPSITENVVANQTAEEILAKDVIQDLLKLEGVSGSFDADKNQLEIKVTKPDKR